VSTGDVPVGKTGPIRVLVVDDHEPWRRFVTTSLQSDGNFVVLGEASDGLEAVQMVKQLQPDLVLLDIGLPRLNGIEAARQIAQLSPQSKILFVSENRSKILPKPRWGHVPAATWSSPMQVVNSFQPCELCCRGSGS